MKCPEIDRLLEVFVDGIEDPTVEAHVAACPHCRGYVTLFDEVTAALEPDITVPKALLARTVASLPQPLERGGSRSFPLWSLLAAGVLGGITAMGSLLLARTVDGGTASRMLLASAAVGIGTMLLKAKRGWGPEAEEATER